ncbi:MAG: zf-HC2 domain-containing protein [Bacteroidetes bacterium]|nr:zf-HC2 domain-containing protein [Bacteroidota bacterium]
MNCKIFEKQIILFIEKELLEKDTMLFSEHLKSCKQCSEKFQFVSENFSIDNNVPEINPYFYKKLLQRIENEEKLGGSKKVALTYQLLNTGIITLIISIAVVIGVLLGYNNSLFNKSNDDTRISSMNAFAGEFAVTDESENFPN